MLHSGQRAFCSAQLRMHPAQKGCSQPLTIAACIGWMFPWQMAHITPSSLPSSDSLSAAATAAAAAAAAATAATASSAVASPSAAAATTASSSSAAAALEVPPAEESVALGASSSSCGAWKAGKGW